MASARPPKSPRPAFRINQYQVAIPSYKRDQTLIKRTLSVLQAHKISPKRVTIFVANEDEYKIYKAALKDSPYRRLVIAEPGIQQVRNFMWNYYAEGTPVLFMDDDIQKVQTVQRDKGNHPKLVDIENFERDVIYRGFDAMREHHAYIWGIYAAANAGFMKSRVYVGLCYIIGSLYGTIIRHDPNLLVGIADKEDYERSVTHFIKDGRVVRLDDVTVKSNYYGEAGGMQVERTEETVNLGAEYMLRKYPKYVRDAGVRTRGTMKGKREVFLSEGQ